ncbi:MAG: hypothetical protein IPH46_07740 [Bacteroidetes bacterium]|nr:hypothetical protein [Bacteroidota bacterium]
MSKVKGIVLYNIELNGKLSGVYTNDDPALKGKIFTEIASRNPAKDVPSKEKAMTHYILILAHRLLRVFCFWIYKMGSIQLCGR